jgi:hypothetical protein
MRRILGAAMTVAFLINFGGLVRGDDQAAQAILDKAIKAMGGEEQLSKVRAAAWKANGKITINGNESEFKSGATIQGIDHIRNEFEGEFNGNTVKGVTVLNGDKAWRKFNDNINEMDDKQLATEKRSVTMQVAPMLLVPLKGKDFKFVAAGEEKVGGKPALGPKVTGPDDKEFTIYFDKESGLPVKQVATVVGRGGQEFAQETTFSDYKEFGGIKKATKLEVSRNGEKFLETVITEFKTLDTVPPETFAEPN